jgi:hypothetical protein
MYKVNNKFGATKNSDFCVSARRHRTDDCMDAGGRAMPGAIAENNGKSAFLEVSK